MTSLSVLIPVGAATETDPWRRNALAWLTTRYEALLPDAELIFGTSTETPFNRSAARNEAFRRSGGDVLLVADADTAWNVDQIHAGLALIDEGAPWVICFETERYYNLTQQATLSVLASDPAAAVAEPTNPNDWELRLTSWAGLLLVPLAAWACASGYPERGFDGGWSYEDNAMRLALDVLAGPHERVDAACLHLWHPRGEEFAGAHVPRHRAVYEEYERAATSEAMLSVCAKYGPDA